MQREHSPNRHSLITLLSAIGLITLPHAWNVRPVTFAFFATLLLWRSLAVWREAWLPNRFVVYGLIAVGAMVLYSQHQGIFGRDAGTALFLVALALKLFELNRERDVYLVTFLAFIVAASQFLYLQSIVMAGYILLVSALLLMALTLQVSKQTPAVQALKTASLIVVQALPLAMLIFLLFPRIEAPRWHWLENENQAKSGLSKVMEPGSISELSLSGELVFRVRFVGDMPPPEQRYWRGPVYTHTDGIRWTASERRYPQTTSPRFHGKVYRYKLMMEPQREHWVFGLEMARQFDPPLARNSQYQLITSQAPGSRAEYKISSDTAYDTGELGNDERAENLQLPRPPSARLTELVKQLKGFDAAPEIYIGNLLRYFREEGFFYTLLPPRMPDNPIETFLFESRHGFCSHYATAFVYLMRIAHIPARVVGGYQGGEFNKIGGFLEIRQADAHAWAEVWLKDKGWVRFDPTSAIAPERIERGVDVDLQLASGAVNFAPVVADATALSWLKRGRQLWQSIDYGWQRWVINYDTRNQRQFLHLLGIDGMGALVKALAGGVALIILPLAWWLLRQPRSRIDRAVVYYQQFLAKLAKADIQIAVGEGPADFCRRARQQRPELAAQIEQITALFIRLRYQDDAREGDLQALKQQIRRLSL